MARGTDRLHAPSKPTRQDQWLVTASLLPLKDKYPATVLGAFDKKTGGEVDSDDNKYYPGGVDVDGPISIGGRKTTGNLTLQRIWDQDNDEMNVIDELYQSVGKGQIQVTIKSKDANGSAMGRPFTYLGTVKRVSLPDFDSESGTGALMEIEIIVQGGYPHVGTRTGSSV